MEPKLINKYVKLKSLTWWAAIVPVFVGVLLALGNVFQWELVVKIINEFAPGVPPAVMINSGLVAIGFRGAIK